MSAPLVWLEADAQVSSADVVGAKMARLAELSGFGVRVPRGFTVTVEAFQEHCDRSGLAAAIEKELSGLSDDTDHERVAAAADSIHSQFIDAPIGASLKALISDAYDDLCYECCNVNMPVAVRSSAIGEDSAQASHAGIFETVLGVAGVLEISRSIQECWASLFTARALHYRLEHGLSHFDSPMAVGVLELIPARASGVAFSIHPVTGRSDRLVIEATWGWGEAIVQGTVTPDHAEVGKSDLRLLSYDIGDKKVVSAFVPTRGRIEEIPMPSRLRNERVLDDPQVHAIADTVILIERSYGHPVDVEWVIERGWREGDPPCVVQARPESVHGGATDESGRAPEEPADADWDPVAYATRYAFGNPE
ncbi:PEP/pyruvate-binding domain-containing protein [Mycolicibacterium gadium]|uniref:Phosphoenolpyruvate synthase n=1 Tax=Mycolicibacterium gadium TaxID=1794 RepID=A0ABT6GYG6_MYCGU|nr:PEP/pyruvate-binding domain-containing protein [Mycolicibacterium gadium]MDG5486714.1 PEP/pyruvate-binding domain-containing protein [Mycolicibacterium gadium]